MANLSLLCSTPHCLLKANENIEVKQFKSNRVNNQWENDSSSLRSRHEKFRKMKVLAIIKLERRESK